MSQTPTLHTKHVGPEADLLCEPERGVRDLVSGVLDSIESLWKRTGAHMVHFAPPTKPGLALLLSGGAQDHDGPWDNFILVVDHTIAVCQVLSRLYNRSKYTHSFVKGLVLDSC